MLLRTQIIILVLGLGLDVLGCGISTHTEIGFRAVEYFAKSSDQTTELFRNILLKHQVLTNNHSEPSVHNMFIGCISSW